MEESDIAFVGLGSNLGDREANLLAAVAEIAARWPLLNKSSTYETEPVGYVDQPPFLNAVCAIRSTVEPRQLLLELKAIERRLGREPSPKWGPRKIDLDILAIGSLVVDEADLQIPHPHLAERLFACLPLAEIAPGYRPPGHEITVSQMRDRLIGGPQVRFWKPATARDAEARPNE